MFLFLSFRRNLGAGGDRAGGTAGGGGAEQAVEVDVGVATVVQANVYVRQQQQQKRRASRSCDEGTSEGCPPTTTLDDAMKTIIRGSKQLYEQKISRGQVD